MLRAARWPLVGREQEVTFLLQVLEEHHGSLVSGAAGVGKSTVLHAVADAARNAGWAVIQVEATAGTAAVPLAPFAGLLPTAMGSDPLDRVRAAASAITEHGERTLLVVDEAHALDEVSVVLVRLLAGSTPTRILLGVRSGERLPDGLVEVIGDAPRVELQALAEPELLRLVEHVLGGPLDASSARRLWAATKGNPLFARELVLDAVERAAVERKGTARRLPEGPLLGRRIGDAVASRLGALDDDARDAIEVLAIGQPIGLTLLERLVSLAALHDLERRGIVSSASAGSRVEVRLAHPLYTEFARASMGDIAERVVRRRLVDAIEATGGRRDGDRLRLAIWRADLGDLTDAGELLAAASALERAHHHAAFVGLVGGRPELLPGCLEAALRLARLALDVSGRMPAADLVARTLGRLGRVTEATELFVALDRYIVDDEDVALAARLRAQVMSVLGMHDAGREILLAAEGAASELAHRRLLAVARLQIEALAGRYLDALATGDLVRASGPLTGDEVIGIAGAVGAALVRTGRAGDALEMLDATLAAATGNEDRLLGVVFARLVALGGLGRGEEASLQLTAIAAVQDEAGDAEQAAIARAMASSISLEQGRPTMAIELAQQAMAGLQTRDVMGMRRVAAAVAATGHALIGRREQATAALADVDVVGTTRAFETDARRASAWALACCGQIGDAADALADAAAEAEARGLTGEETLVLHDLVRLGRAKVAIARLEHLATTVQGPLAPLARDHARALLTGDGASLDAVAEQAATLGLPLVAADAAAQAEGAHRAAGLKARAAASRRLCRGLLAVCEGATTPAVREQASDARLTGRERDVAELAARGLTDKEIAAALGASTRTITTHLARIYAKLGAGGRRDLAALLGQSLPLEQ